MARGLNKVVLIGNLGKDPEIQVFDGIKKASFSLATTEILRDREGRDVQHTEWHSIIMWRGLADVAEQFLHKGSQVFIEGRIRSRSYDGKDGVKRFVTEILADQLIMLNSRKENESSTTTTYSAPTDEVVDDSTPF